MKKSNINLFNWMLTMLDETEKAANNEYAWRVQGIREVKDLIRGWLHNETNKKTIAILDPDDHGKLVGEISTMVTTKEQIEKIVGEVKRTIDDWTYDDICKALPDDCEITWFNGQDDHIEI